jgi:hypothetical protein
MGHHKLREDKKCQNCGFIVRRRFCPKCGQENIETRQTFFYLFTHFIEDLVHYDGSFWKTIKNLMFFPGKLTREYLNGRRKEYVAPVKLYIFISFFVFFVGGLINKLNTTAEVINNVNFTPSNQNGISQNQTNDSITVFTEESWPLNTTEKNIQEYDSIQNTLSEFEKDKGIERFLKRKEIELKQRYTRSQWEEKIVELAKSNIPKFLFAYMPVFAFFMWLFHSKKKWYYFDHGIFTLHYFSFLLLSSFIIIAINTLNNLCGTVLGSFNLFMGFVINAWAFFYFFLAHKKVYNYSKTTTLFRGLFLFGLNMVFLTFGIAFYFFIIFYLM